MKRTIALILITAMLSVGCDNNDTTASTPSTDPPTTTADTATTTTSTTSNTPVTTTTTTIRETDPTEPPVWKQLIGLDYPKQPVTISDLPAPYLDYLDRPAPDPDLTIEGPEDVDRWINEWIDWMIWLGANPDQGQGQVDVGWIPETPQGEATQQGLTEQARQGIMALGLPFTPIRATGSFDEFFENDKVLSLFVDAVDDIPRYEIDAEGTIETTDPGGGGATLQLVLREDGEGQWRVEQIQVVEQSS